MTEEKDTSKYRPVRCYRCGEPFRAYTFSEVWDMRIDGKMHNVPLFSVPCMRCDNCDLTVTDGGSDEAIAWARNTYLQKNGLNTPWLRFRRWLRRQRFRVYDRWNWYMLRFDKWRGKYQ
jgi:hypothetical protein